MAKSKKRPSRQGSKADLKARKSRSRASKGSVRKSRSKASRSSTVPGHIVDKKSSKDKVKKKRKSKASLEGAAPRGSTTSLGSRSAGRRSTSRSSGGGSAKDDDDDADVVVDSKRGKLPDEDLHYFGFYRNLKTKADELKRFKLLGHVFNRTFPWPPKHRIFFSTGYYMDMDKGGAGAADMGVNQILLRGVPDSVTDEEIMKQFPTATGVIRKDGEVRVKFATIPEAKKAFQNSKLYKLGDRILLWPPKPGIIVTDIPLGTSVDDLKAEFPEATDIFMVPGPGNKYVAAVWFPDESARDSALQSSSYKRFGKKGDYMLKYKKDKLTVTISNVPEDMTEADLRKRFPRAKKIHIDDGVAKLTYLNRKDLLADVKKSGFLQLGDPTKLSFLDATEISVERMVTGANEEYLRQTYPDAEKMTFSTNKRGEVNAIVRFGTPEEALKAIRHKNVRIFGDPVQRRVNMKLPPLNWKVDEKMRRQRLYAQGARAPRVRRPKTDANSPAKK